MMRPTANTTRMAATAIGRSGTSPPFLTRTGGRRLPLPAPDRTAALVLVAITLGRIPAYPFWLRLGGTMPPIDRGLNPQEGGPHCGITKFSTSFALTWT